MKRFTPLAVAVLFAFGCAGEDSQKMASEPTPSAIKAKTPAPGQPLEGRRRAGNEMLAEADRKVAEHIALWEYKMAVASITQVRDQQICESGAPVTWETPEEIADRILRLAGECGIRDRITALDLAAMGAAVARSQPMTDAQVKEGILRPNFPNE